MLLANSSSSSTTRILCSIALSRCHPEQQPDRGPHLLLTAQGDRTVEPLHDPLDQHQAQVVELGLNAETQAEALHLAAAQDLRALSIRAVRRPWQHKGSGFSLLLFSQELCTLLDAGLALIDALESLTEKASTEDAGRLLGQLVRLLYEGKSFSQALEGFPAAFPPVYVALVRSSEETGSVSDALARYVGYRQRLDELRAEDHRRRGLSPGTAVRGRRRHAVSSGLCGAPLQSGIRRPGDRTAVAVPSADEYRTHAA